MIETSYKIQKNDWRFTDLAKLGRERFTLLKGDKVESDGKLDSKKIGAQFVTSSTLDAELKNDVEKVFAKFETASLIAKENKEWTSDIFIYVPDGLEEDISIGDIVREASCLSGGLSSNFHEQETIPALVGKARGLPAETVSESAVNSSATAVLRNFRVTVVVGKNAKARIKENMDAGFSTWGSLDKSSDEYDVSRTTSTNEYWHNYIMRYYLDEDASLTIERNQNEAANATHFSASLIYQKANSDFKLVIFNYGAQTARSEIFNILDGDNARSEIYGLVKNVACESAHFDIFLNIDHRVSNCTSYQRIKNVLDRNGYAAFQGSIIVREGTKDNVAEQSCASLLLSPMAKIDALPQLKIFSKDVKCKHGATTGNLNDEELFYMMSRGISEEVARAMQIEAFEEEVILKRYAYA